MGTRSDGGEDPVLAQDPPERDAFPQQPHAGLPQRPLILAQADGPPRRPDLDRAQFRMVAVPVGREEIENIVLARIHPRLKRGPGDGRNRRDGGGQRLEAAALGQGRHVRQLAFGQELLREPIVQAVQPQDHEALDAAAGQCPPAADGPHDPADGPGKQHQNRGKDGGQEGKKRAGQGEAGPRPDIGLGRTGKQQDQQRSQEEQFQRISHVAGPKAGIFIGSIAPFYHQDHRGDKFCRAATADGSGFQPTVCDAPGLPPVA